MAEVTWIKLSTDFFENRKIRYLRHGEDGASLVLMWVQLLTMAGRCNDSGRVGVTAKLPYSHEALSGELGLSQKTVIRGLQKMANLEMLTLDEEGFVVILGWEEHQNLEAMEKLRQQNRLRKQRQRAKGVTVTQCHAAEEEEEEEKEIENKILEKEREKELDPPIPQKNEMLQRKYLRGELGQGVVLLSEGQIEDLLDRLSLEEFERYVQVVAQAELSGKHYRRKTHYEAILEMAQQDRRGATGKKEEELPW